MTKSASIQPIIRSKFTWLAYLMLGYYAYMQASLGPLMPFLRTELSLNYTLAGFHFSAFAIGMILAGSSGDQLVNRFGRKAVFWIGASGMSIGALILTAGQTAIVTISGAFMMGFIGTYLLVMVQALLSDEFSENRTVALTESNLIAVMFSASAPLLISLSLNIGFNWRLALWIGTVFCIFTYWIARNIEFPANNIAQDQQQDSQNTKLPPIYWLYWTVVFVGVAIEACMIFWLADFLIVVADLPPDVASTIVSLFLGSMIVGRLVGSRLSYHLSSPVLLLIMSGMIMIGFPLFWLIDNLLIRVIGLMIIGPGLANIFPLSLSSASNAGSMNVDKASARVSQAAGFSILIAPQTLGVLADSLGIFRAYIILPLLLIILMLMITFAFYVERSKNK